MNIKIEADKTFPVLNGFLERALEVFDIGVLDQYGKMGVKALEEATPKLTGKTAKSWFYEIERNNGTIIINWNNKNVVKSKNTNTNVAILIQYGHGNKRGAYVEGKDYINPALRPVIEEIASKINKEIGV